MQSGSSGTVLGHLHTLFVVGAVGALSDEQLLERLLTGKKDDAEAAFGVLVQRHGPMVLGVCRGVLKDPHDTADAFQATFLVLARRVGSIRLRGSLAPWLYGVARRVSVRARVAAARRQLLERQAADAPAFRYGPEEDRHEDLAALHEEIARLPGKYRLPVVLCYLEGLSYEMAARSLHLTESTIRGRLARARKLLAVRLGHRGVAIATGLLAAGCPRQSSATVPSAMANATVQTAVQIVKDVAVVRDAVTALTEGVLRSMLMTKIKFLSSAVLTTGMLTLGALVFARQGTEDRPPAQGVDRAVQPGDSRTNLGAAVTAQEGQDEKAEVEESLAKMVDGRIIRSADLTKDCMVLSYMPDWAFGDVDNIAVANNDGGVRTLLSWREINPEVASMGLRFVIALYSRKTTTGATAGPILAFELGTAWPERTSWKTLPEYDTEPVASFKFSPGEGWKMFDITPVVQAQAKAGRKSNGVMLRFLSEDRSGAKQNWSGYAFVSREGAGDWANRTPWLLVLKPAKQ